MKRLFLLFIFLFFSTLLSAEKAHISIYYDSLYPEFSKNFIDVFKQRFDGIIESVTPVSDKDVDNPKVHRKSLENVGNISISIGNSPVLMLAKSGKGRFKVISLFFNESTKPDVKNIFYIPPFVSAEEKIGVLRNYFTGFKSIVLFSTPSRKIKKENFSRDVKVMDINDRSEILEIITSSLSFPDPIIFIMPEDSVMDYSPQVIRKLVRETISKRVVFAGFNRNFQEYGFLINYDIPLESYTKRLSINIKSIMQKKEPENSLVPDYFIYLNDILLKESGINIKARDYKLKIKRTSANE